MSSPHTEIVEGAGEALLDRNRVARLPWWLRELAKGLADNDEIGGGRRNSPVSSTGSTCGQQMLAASAARPLHLDGGYNRYCFPGTGGAVTRQKKSMVGDTRCSLFRPHPPNPLAILSTRILSTSGS